MKILLYTGIFTQTEQNLETVKLWARLVTHLNRDENIQIVAFDSESPFDPAKFLPDGIQIIRLGSNPGHLSQGGGDGAGRTFCAGLTMASNRGFDYAVHLESDFFLAKPIKPLVERMAKASVKAAACFLPQYQFPEFGLCAMDVRHMASVGFVEAYNWEKSPQIPIPERRIMQLMGDDLWIIPWYGARNDQNQLNPMTLISAFPYAPPDFLTHCSLDLANEFIRINNTELP